MIVVINNINYVASNECTVISAKNAVFNVTVSACGDLLPVTCTYNVIVNDELNVCADTDDNPFGLTTAEFKELLRVAINQCITRAAFIFNKKCAGKLLF